MGTIQDFILNPKFELTHLVIRDKPPSLFDRVFRQKKIATYLIDATELKKEDDFFVVSYKNAKLADEYYLLQGIYFSKIKNKLVFDSEGERIGRIIDAIIHIDYKISLILGGSYIEEILEDMKVIPDLDIFLPTSIITSRDKDGNFHVKYERKMFERKASRPDIIRGVEFDRFPGQRHYTFYKMRIELDHFVGNTSWIPDKIGDSKVASDVEIRNFDHKDSEMFMELHDEIFFKSPDPVRSLTKEEVILYDEESTFVAWYFDNPIGFVYLPIFVAHDGQLEGSIAGIGVVNKYRGQKVALSLIQKCVEYFQSKGVFWVSCEVFEKNEPSRNMFEGLGFEIYDHMVLEKRKTKS